jgi:hypothetical protein
MAQGVHKITEDFEKALCDCLNRNWFWLDLGFDNIKMDLTI